MISLYATIDEGAVLYCFTMENIKKSIVNRKEININFAKI